MTLQNVLDLIIALIIPNNEGLIDDAKMRQVLNQMALFSNQESNTFEFGGIALNNDPVYPGLINKDVLMVTTNTGTFTNYVDESTQLPIVIPDGVLFSFFFSPITSTSWKVTSVTSSSLGNTNIANSDLTWTQSRNQNLDNFRLNFLLGGTGAGIRVFNNTPTNDSPQLQLIDTYAALEMGASQTKSTLAIKSSGGQHIFIFDSEHGRYQMFNVREPEDENDKYLLVWDSSDNEIYRMDLPTDTTGVSTIIDNPGASTYNLQDEETTLIIQSYGPLNQIVLPTNPIPNKNYQIRLPHDKQSFTILPSAGRTIEGEANLPVAIAVDNCYGASSFYNKGCSINLLYNQTTNQWYVANISLMWGAPAGGG